MKAPLITSMKQNSLRQNELYKKNGCNFDTEYRIMKELVGGCMSWEVKLLADGMSSHRSLYFSCSLLCEVYGLHTTSGTNETVLQFQGPVHYPML